jgi:hypothetical protein
MAKEGNTMVTTLALYTGETLGEFELIGLTTHPEIIAAVVELIEAYEPHVLPMETYARRGRTWLQIVEDESDG